MTPLQALRILDDRLKPGTGKAGGHDCPCATCTETREALETLWAHVLTGK